MESQTLTFMVFSSTGNATDYGDLTQAIAKFVRSISNSTSAVANLGSIGGTGLQNVLEYINMDSTGSTVDFGDLTNIHYTGATTQSSTKRILSRWSRFSKQPVLYEHDFCDHNCISWNL